MLCRLRTDKRPFVFLSECAKNMSLVVYSAHSRTHSRTHSLFQRSVFWWKESDALIVTWVQTNHSLQIWHSIKLQIGTHRVSPLPEEHARAVDTLGLGTRSGTGDVWAGLPGGGVRAGEAFAEKKLSLWADSADGHHA